jgi:alpha-L-fucosidase
MKVCIKSLLILALFITACTAGQDKQNVPASGKDSDRDHYLDWFREAKFGMFVHWGPYSMLEGEWNGRQVQVGRNAEWIMKFLTIPVDEYRGLAREMNPVRFDAREWVNLAKATGMKYIVITAKHHDGFAMYHSQVSPYNIVDWTPFARDPIKELAEACAEEGIKFCVYYSHREDWDHPGGYGNNWDYDNDWGSDIYDPVKFEEYLEEKAKPQLRELLTNYGPIGLVWFDRGMYTPEQGREFVELVRELQPETLVNSRIGHYEQELIGDYQSMNDNGMPPGGLQEYWEAPMTLNETWGYSRFDDKWTNAEKVIQRLVEIVSRGGNYLLNIGPKGSGEIPEPTIEIFREVGQWVNRNEESIYGTTANPFGELGWGYCTVKENKIYLFVRDWPGNGKLVLPGLRNKIMSAYLLIDRSTSLSFVQDEKIHIDLPPKAPDAPISVLVLETDGIPEVNPPYVSQSGAGEIRLDYMTAVTHGSAKTRFNRKGGFHISKWVGPEDAVDWRVHVKQPGRYRMDITYAAGKEWEGKPFEISMGDKKFERQVIRTGNLFQYHKFTVGYLELTEEGEYIVSIKPKASGDSYLMYLQSITLQPVDNSKMAGWGN